MVDGAPRDGGEVMRAIALVATLCAVPTWQQAPTFRARTELVRVDVLVERDGHPVAGLTATDFHVRDNGVPQTVTSAKAMGHVALGVAMDASGSMSGERLDLAAAALEALLGGLVAGDSYDAVAFATQVRLLGASDQDNGPSPADALRSVQPRGRTALIDAAYAAVVLSDRAAGPKLVAVMTDGRNNFSWLSARQLIDTARRHESVIYPVAVGFPEGTKYRGPGAKVTFGEFWDSRVLLQTIAKDTGGRLIEADWTSDLPAVFKGILEEYRQRYVLTFTPEGVGLKDGWHELDVRLRRGPRAAIHARRGYWAR
jgi:VWFA-related protein